MTPEQALTIVNSVCATALINRLDQERTVQAINVLSVMIQNTNSKPLAAKPLKPTKKVK